MEWIGSVRYEKFQSEFVAQTFTLIALVHLVLHRVSCSYETIPNAPKHYETHQNKCIGCNGVDKVYSLQKKQCDFMAQTFVWIEPVQYVLQQVSCNYKTIPNAPKYYETDRNISLGSNGVDWVHSLWKILSWLVARTFVWIEPVQYVLQQVPCSYKTIPNAPKHYATRQNMSLGSNGVDWVH